MKSYSMKATKSSRRPVRGGVHGSSVGRQMGGPKFGQMQTPARLASTRKVSGRRR